MLASCREKVDNSIKYGGGESVNIVLLEELKLNATTESDNPITYYSDNDMVVTVNSEGVIKGKNVGMANVTISNTIDVITVKVTVSLYEEPTTDFYVSKDEISKIYGQPNYIVDSGDTTVYIYGSGNDWYSYAVWEMDFFFIDDQYIESDLYIRSDVETRLDEFLNNNYYYQRSDTINQGNDTTEIYHNYPYWLYWYCAKILGYGKCDLVLVPINMQFKLVIRGTFSEYPIIDDDYPPIENEKCTVTITNEKNKTTELNLILEDTYSINSIPANKRALKTIRITRQGLNNAGRHFCESFVEATMEEIRSQAERITVNVFATTNPKNSLHIAKRVFKAASRANVSHLYVFQQNKNKATDRWYFEERGHKIY